MGRRKKTKKDKKKTKETKKTKDEHVSATGDQPEGLIQILFNHFSSYLSTLSYSSPFVSPKSKQ